MVKVIKATQIDPLIGKASLITADAGYHSEANLKEQAIFCMDLLL